MSKEQEYRHHAASALDLAQRASSPSDKNRLLVMAQAWFDLAERLQGRNPRDALKGRDVTQLLDQPDDCHASEVD